MKVLVEFGKPQVPGKQGHHYGYHLCDSPLEAALLASQIRKAIAPEPNEPLSIRHFVLNSYTPRASWESNLRDAWVTVTAFDGWATDAQIDTVTKHYIVACIWADKPEEIKAEPRVSKADYAKAREDCAAFIKACGQHFSQAMACFRDGYGTHPDAGSAEAAFGHDFWLTRQGHGTGFWDRKELPEALGEKLTEIAKAFGEASPEFYRGKLSFL